MIVPERLRERMQALGLSQAELARRVNVRQPSIFKLLSGQAKNSVHLHNIARELDTTAEYLSGLSDDPNSGAATQAPRPSIQYFSMKVALPSEAALRDMFRGLLALVPAGATSDEAAAILSRRLPAALAAIGPLALDPSVASQLAPDEALPDPSKDRPGGAPA